MGRANRQRDLLGSKKLTIRPSLQALESIGKLTSYEVFVDFLSESSSTAVNKLVVELGGTLVQSREEADVPFIVESMSPKQTLASRLVSNIEINLVQFGFLSPANIFSQYDGGQN